MYCIYIYICMYTYTVHFSLYEHMGENLCSYLALFIFRRAVNTEHNVNVQLISKHQLSIYEHCVCYLGSCANSEPLSYNTISLYLNMFLFPIKMHVLIIRMFTFHDVHIKRSVLYIYIYIFVNR